MIKNIDHVTVAVSDINAAKDFFSLLDFKEERDVVISGGKFGNYMMIDNIEAEHMTLVLQNSNPRFEIQLLKFHHPEPHIDSHINHLDKLGYNHICFAVDNITNVVDHLIANGVEILNEVMTFHNRKLVYFAGPDGIILELAEWAS